MKRLRKITRYIRRSALFKALILIMILVFAIITQTGCSNKEVSKTDFALNTSCTITVGGMSEKEANDILTEAFDVMRQYEDMLSRTVEGSDIYRINNAGGEAVEVSDETIEVLRQGIAMGELSGGRFDITVGRLTDMWNFTGEDPSVPPQEEIDAALPAVDYRNIHLDGNRVTLADPGAAIDLGGIAKGYIADKLAEFLMDKGVESAVINLGGNVETVGAKADGSSWTVGIERPYSDRTELMGKVSLDDGTLVTSGIYERNFEEDGVLYHHVLDPDTGYPAESDLEAVTIMAVRGNSAFCDGLSTVCLMLGKDEAMQLVEQLQEEYPDMGLEAAFIDKEDEMVQTEGMDIQAAD